MLASVAHSITFQCASKMIQSNAGILSNLIGACSSISPKITSQADFHLYFFSAAKSIHSSLMQHCTPTFSLLASVDLLHLLVVQNIPSPFTILCFNFHGARGASADICLINICHTPVSIYAPHHFNIPFTVPTLLPFAISTSSSFAVQSIRPCLSLLCLAHPLLNPPLQQFCILIRP